MVTPTKKNSTIAKMMINALSKPSEKFDAPEYMPIVNYLKI
jgi:hypothetical protein